MLAFKLLFLLCLFNFAESCLKIRYPGPPKCECPSLLLNGNTYEQYDVTGVIPTLGAVLTAPPVMVLEDEDCAVSMYCESDLELLVFDTDKTYEFLNYPADGMCDPYTQKWLIGDNEGTLITVNRLYGVCWKLSNPPVTQVPATTGGLPSWWDETCFDRCIYHLLPDFNSAEEWFEYDPFFQSNLTFYRYNYDGPTVAQRDSENICPIKFNCREGYHLVMRLNWDFYVFNATEVKIECSPFLDGFQWFLTHPIDILIYDVYAVCVAFVQL
ncbi:hypothetical protein B9Z55_002744 [Caenorhabditis nigoni]|nr:hypothetical protein B9Z55_002744 [Caenorhabditis nigoni]